MEKSFFKNPLTLDPVYLRKEQGDINVNIFRPSLTIKRISEVALSLLILLTICTWLFPVLALMIKIGSKGPVFFKQLRHGKDNASFYCYKFRTMIENEGADTIQAKKGDSRVTRLGAILRKSSIDELPQLINILKGDMSLVGPRPHAVPMNEVFSKEIRGYMDRHSMKPGLTGLAQSRGARGEIKNYHDLNKRYRLDMFYINNWNLFFDLKIIMWTAYSLVFKNKKVY